METDHRNDKGCDAVTYVCNSPALFRVVKGNGTTQLAETAPDGLYEYTWLRKKLGGIVRFSRKLCFKTRNSKSGYMSKKYFHFYNVMRNNI